MKYLLSLIVLLLVSCSETSNTNVSDQFNIPDMKCTPVGATYIKSVKSNNGYDITWTIWKFEQQCYMSQLLCNNAAVLTKIVCPPN